MSSRRRSPGWRSGHRSSRGLNGHGALGAATGRRHGLAGRRRVAVAGAAWRAGGARCRPRVDPGGRGGVAELPRRRLRQPRPRLGVHHGPRATAASSRGSWWVAAARAGPTAPIPLAAPEIYQGDASRLAVSWFGHSTALVEIDGYRVLTDPVWSDRCSPSDIVGPQRLHPPPVQLEGLPAVDAVVISHDHYDHLDIDTVHHVGPHAAGPVLRAARCRCPPSVVGHPRAPHRRTRLESERAGRRAHRDLHAGAALLGALLDPQQHAVGVVGVDRPDVIARISAATPATPRASRRSARTTDRST